MTDHATATTTTYDDDGAIGGRESGTNRVGGDGDQTGWEKPCCHHDGMAVVLCVHNDLMWGWGRAMVKSRWKGRRAGGGRTNEERFRVRV